MVLHILFGILTGMRSLILPDTPKMSKTWVIRYLKTARASVAKMQQFHCGLWKRLPSLHLWHPLRHSYEENIVYSSVSPVKSITVIHCSGLSLQSTWKMNRTSGLDRVLQDMNPCLNKICSALSTAKSETDPQSKQWHNTIGQLPLLLSRCRSSALQSRGSTFCIVFFRIPPMSATQATKCDIWINNWTFIVYIYIIQTNIYIYIYTPLSS